MTLAPLDGRGSAKPFSGADVLFPVLHHLTKNCPSLFFFLKQPEKRDKRILVIGQHEPRNESRRLLCGPKGVQLYPPCHVTNSKKWFAKEKTFDPHSGYLGYPAQDEVIG